MTMQLPDLRTRAMLATLTISVWNPKKKDTGATLDTLIKHGASKDAGAFIKNLLPDGAIDPVKRAEGKIRAAYYRYSMPWRDGGIRILPGAAWEDFSAGIREARSEFDAAVGQFLLDYDGHRAKAKLALNGMFREEDYPPVDEVRAKFSVQVSWYPIPDSEDFRVDLPADAREQVQKEIAETVGEAMRQANADLYGRLSDALTRVVDRLKDPENVFRDTLITNLRDLCADIPKLNVADDATLQGLAKHAEEIAALDPDQIRGDEGLRAEAHKTAEDILRNMGMAFPAAV